MKRSERSNGPDTALYKNCLYLFYLFFLLEYALGAIQSEWQPRDSMSSVRCAECCVVRAFFVQLNVPVSTLGFEDSEKKLCPIELWEYIVERWCVVVWSFYCFIKIIWV